MRVRGLTLLECMVALTILPLAVAAIAYAVVAGQSQAVEVMHRERAAQLAESLMEEIVVLAYDSSADSSLGPEGGETTRSAYDSANDFHGFTETAGDLTDAAGTAYPGPMQPFSRSVSCQAVPVTVTEFGDPIDTLEVTVTVSDDAGDLITLTRTIADGA